MKIVSFPYLLIICTTYKQMLNLLQLLCSWWKRLLYIYLELRQATEYLQTWNSDRHPLKSDLEWFRALQFSEFYLGGIQKVRLSWRTERKNLKWTTNGGGGRGSLAYLYVHSVIKIASFFKEQAEFFLISCLAVVKRFVVLSLVHDVKIFLLKKRRHFFFHLTFFMNL